MTYRGQNPNVYTMGDRIHNDERHYLKSRPSIFFRGFNLQSLCQDYVLQHSIHGRLP